MSKITTPLQALEEIRAVCWSEARRENVTSATFEMLRRQVAELAMDGMRSAAEPAGLTPVQQAAEKLKYSLRWTLNFIETYAADAMGPATPEFNKVRALLDELDPPKPPTPPTLEEAVEMLRKLATATGTSKQAGALTEAWKIIDRGPK